MTLLAFEAMYLIALFARLHDGKHHGAAAL
jgi:hypothetical protein